MTNVTFSLFEIEAQKQAASLNTAEAPFSDLPKILQATALDFLKSGSQTAHSLLADASNSSSIPTILPTFGNSPAPSPAGPLYPAPIGDNGSPTVPLPSDFSGDGIYDWTTNEGIVQTLAAMIGAMAGNQDGLAQMQIFFESIKSWAASGALNNPTIQALLDPSKGGFDLKGFLTEFILKNAELACVEGYGGATPGTLQGGLNWINDQLKTIDPNTKNPILQNMISLFNTTKELLPSWVAGQTDSQGRFSMEVKGSNGVVYATYYLPDDEANIAKLITRAGISGTPSKFWQNLNMNKFYQNYRMQLFNYIMGTTSDKAEACMIFIMMQSDDQYQNSSDSFAHQDTALSDLTNNYATKAQSIFSQCGSLTPDQAEQLGNVMNDWMMNVSTESSTQGMVQNFGNAYSQFWSANVSFKGSDGQMHTDSLWNVFHNVGGKYKKDDFASALNAINPPGAQSNPLFQTLTNAMQQAGTLISQQSKTIGTQLGAIENSRAQVDKSLGSICDPQGNGFAAFTKYLAEHQISG